MFTIWNKACDASFLKHSHNPVIHFGILHFKNEETSFYSAGPISRYSLKIYLDLTMLFNVYFLYRKSWTFWGTDKNCTKLDKNKSIVSRFSVFVVYKSAVSTVQKSNYVGCFNFRHWMFVFAHLFPDISIKSTKLHFQSWKKIPSTISLSFCKMTAEVSRNNCAKRHEDWKFPWYILNISKLAGSKFTTFRVCLSSLQYISLLKD